MTACEPRAPFLLLAHHRSGSNFLNDLLQSHPALECINEPLSMHTRFFRQCDLVRWSRADHDTHLLHRDLAGQAGLRDFLDELRRYLLRSTHERVVGFKETVLFGKLEWLKAFLPSLKIVYLTREPHAVVSSVLRSGLTELWRYRDLVPPAFLALHPHYQSRVDPCDAPAREAELAAMSVATRQALARRTLHLFEHRVLALEAVMQDPARCMQALTDFLGVAPHPDQATFLARRQGASRGGAFSSFRVPEEVQSAWRRHLSARQVEAVEHVMAAAGQAALAGSHAMGSAA